MNRLTVVVPDAEMRLAGKYPVNAAVPCTLCQRRSRAKRRAARSEA